MPRHEALIPLSREHHHTLVLALRLKKGGPTTTKDNWPIDLEEQRIATLRFFRHEILPHFALEERTIFPAAVHIAAAQAIVQTLRAQHHEIARRFQSLDSISAEDAPTLLTAFRELGELLDTHIRLEERTLFPLMERELSTAAWDRIRDGHELPEA